MQYNLEVRSVNFATGQITTQSYRSILKHEVEKIWVNSFGKSIKMPSESNNTGFEGWDCPKYYKLEVMKENTSVFTQWLMWEIE